MFTPKSRPEVIAALPAILRALLEAELASGNEISEHGHTFPAPPAGAYFLLTKPLQTRPQKSGDGIVYYDRNGLKYSGEITDSKRFYFLLEPPHPPEPEPDLNAIRATLASAPKPKPQQVSPANQPVARASVSPKVTSRGRASGDAPKKLTLLQRFERSLVIDFDKWHDGIGYDLDTLRAMSPAERAAAEALLIRRGVNEWRDVEALACFKTSSALAVLRAAMNHADAEVRSAVLRHAPELVSDATRIASLVDGLEHAVFFGGMRQTLEHVENFHPAPIIEALFRGALNRPGEIAVHFAAMLYFIHGHAPEPFDFAQRPFFLRFNTTDRTERETAFRELCKTIGADATRYLAKPTSRHSGSRPAAQPNAARSPRPKT